MFKPRNASVLVLLLLCACAGVTEPEPVPGDGHAVHLDGTARLLIGDSATQAVLQNANFDLVAWLDDLESKGIRSAMVWAFMAVRQTSDGRVIEGRYGYVVPDIGPWTRDLPGPPANDGRPRWNLNSFDEGSYWPRLRHLLEQTRARDMVLWITIFDGWAKEVGEIPFHPFRRENGGPLARGEDFVVLDDYGREVEPPYQETWPWQRKNQWFQERFAERLAREVEKFPNVILEIFNEGEWYDQDALIRHQRHFLQFFKKRLRTPLALNADHARLSRPWHNADIDIVSWHTRGFDARSIHGRWLDGFGRSPSKPVVNSETVPPFPRGYGEEVSEDQVRRLVWTTLMAGGHVFVQDDSAFAFDPRATREDGDRLRAQLGIASRYLEEIGHHPGRFAPAPRLSDAGFCLARGTEQLLVYLPQGGRLRLRLPEHAGYGGEWLDPRSGKRHPVEVARATRGGARLAAPDEEDWVLHLRRTSPSIE